uniref:Uncharacterized protein n=1 Tax=Haptolina brevifila TaxID=156173 RepID=A0A7S2BUV3_9EUKA
MRVLQRTAHGDCDGESPRAMACEASCVSTSGSAAGKVECDVGRLEADSDVAVGIEPESDMGGESAAHIVGIGGARSALPAKEVTCALAASARKVFGGLIDALAASIDALAAGTHDAVRVRTSRAAAVSATLHDWRSTSSTTT